MFLSLIVTCRLFVIAGLYVLQRIGSTQEGNTSFTLSGDYYNRELSGNNTYFRFDVLFLTMKRIQLQVCSDYQNLKLMVR